MTYEEYFISCYPNEGVGYFKDGEFFPLENIAEDKVHSFEVDPSFMLLEPTALLHSHTVPVHHGLDPRTPSQTDLASQIATDIEWGVCYTDGERCSEPLWWGNPNNRPPLEGRNFVSGVYDCLSLARDYYHSVGIDVPHHAYDVFWAQDGEDHIGSLWKDWGFEEVELADLQPGDALLYQVRSPVINHIGIYLGDNQVLSHWYGRLSCVESFGTWARYIQKAIRKCNPQQ